MFATGTGGLVRALVSSVASSRVTLCSGAVLDEYEMTCVSIAPLPSAEMTGVRFADRLRVPGRKRNAASSWVEPLRMLDEFRKSKEDAWSPNRALHSL